MTREEFEMRLPDCTRKPSDEDFSVIQEVYNYHPAFNCNCSNPKEKIANLYFEYGMRVICDMQETAKRMQEIESEQRALRIKLDRLKEEAQELAML